MLLRIFSVLIRYLTRSIFSMGRLWIPVSRVPLKSSRLIRMLPLCIIQTYQCRTERFWRNATKQCILIKARTCRWFTFTTPRPWTQMFWWTYSNVGQILRLKIMTDLFQVNISLLFSLKTTPEWKGLWPCKFY